MSKLKEALLKALHEQIELRLQNAQKAMEAAEDSRNNETKSSVGDKYETGRAMMQEEYDRNKVSYLKAKQSQTKLREIKINPTTNVVEQGSLIHTNYGIFFLSIGVGKVIIEDLTIYCLSMEAPLGKNLLNKNVGDEVNFLNKTFIIKDIA